MLDLDLEHGLPKSSGDDWITGDKKCSFESEAVEHNIFDPQYRFSDGLRIFRFTVASQSQQPRWHDKLRIRLEQSQSGSGAMLSTSGTSNEISNPSDNGRTKEIYLCVDKVLVEVQQTTLCPIPRVDALPDDKALLCQMREQLRDCNSWFKNLISWKTCTEVKFVTFKIARDRDVVSTDFALPKEPHDYEYKDSDRPEFIKIYLETIVARNLLCGIHDTEAGAGETDLIDHMLKKRNPPQLDTRAYAYGLRAMQGLSLKKICWWTAVGYILGLAFVIFWLSFVDKLDLQNAFMPVTVLAMMLAGAVATTQVLV
ncbi:hypothetical protein LQW54_011243 [Pestalotiopsis sp. IQ-011]